MRLSNYNMAVVESALKGLKAKGIKFKVVAQKSDVDMIFEIVFQGVKKLVWIHEGVAVAGINA